jgi:hypothetical protein
MSAQILMRSPKYIATFDAANNHVMNRPRGI